MIDNRRWIAAVIAWGTLAGAAETAFVYSIDRIFPGRNYVLPENPLALAALAIGADVVLAAAIALPLAWLARQVRVGRPALWLGALGAIHLGILLVAWSRAYYVFPPSSRALAIVGVAAAGAVIGFALTGVATALGRRFGAIGSAGAWGLAMAALVALTLPGVQRHEAARASDGELPSLSRRPLPDIVLVTLDTVRADFTAPYGHPFIETPALDRLARDGVVFERAFVQAPLTTPSHCSIFTSTYVNEHGAMNGSAMRSGLVTLAEILQAAGYDTAAFVSAAVMHSGISGLDRGFAHYEDSVSRHTTLLRHDVLQYALLPALFALLSEAQIEGGIVNERAFAWLSRPRESPFFAWLHYYDAHDPHDPAPEFDRYRGRFAAAGWIQDLVEAYAGEISEVDALVGDLLAWLDVRGRYEETMVIVTADHGEAFGEVHDGQLDVGHGDFLYDTTLHVPLIWKLPGNAWAGTRVPAVVQSVDIAPTLLALLGGAAPPSFRGASLLPLLEGKEATDGIAFAEARGAVSRLPRVGEAVPSGRSQLSVRDGAHKLVRVFTPSARDQLYDLRRDPSETTNLLASQPEVASRLGDAIPPELADEQTGTATRIDPKVLEQLEALGYVGE